jgi:hypothetical protein
LQTAALALVKRQNYGDTLPIAPIAETKIPGRSLPGALAPREGGNQLNGHERLSKGYRRIRNA